VAIACLSAGRPPAGVYLWFFGSRHALTASSTIHSGVGKSGSPAPNPITFSPAAWRALALASTASVAEGAIAARRAETRFTPAEATCRLGTGRGPVTAAPVRSADVTDTPQITLDPAILPADGRFGCGPSKVRPEQLQALVSAGEPGSGSLVIGTSHRQPAVKNVVGSVRAGLTELFGLPDGWEIVLGNGGTTVFWDAASFGLVEQRSQHLVFGEFSSKFADVCAKAPHLGDPTVIESATGDHPDAVAEDGIDVYAFTHNETSTGVAMQLRRPAGVADGALVAVDA